MITRSRYGVFALGLGLALVAGGSLACERGSSTSKPSDSNGPKVIVEQPGETPEVPDPSESVDGSDGDGIEVATELRMSDVPCSSDADCLATTCCHPDACGAPSDAPNCSATLCTDDCRAGTMDCFGGCLCQEGRCAAKIWLGEG